MWSGRRGFAGTQMEREMDYKKEILGNKQLFVQVQILGLANNVKKPI